MRILSRIIRNRFPVMSNFNRPASIISGSQGLSKPTRVFPLNESVFSHLTNKEITLGITNVYSENIIKGTPDPIEPTLIMLYKPDCFRYELKEPECMDEFVNWTKQYRMYNSLGHQLRVLDLSRFESMLTGALEDNYERKLLALKLIELPFILDDMAEKLVGSQNPAAKKLAIKIEENAMKILFGEPCSSINVSEYAKDCPVEAELCREYEDAAVHVHNECRRLMSPRLLNGFKEILRQTLEFTLLEYENMAKHLPNKKFASKEESVEIKPLATFFPHCVWATIDEKDMAVLNPESPMLKTMALVSALENDVVSVPKEITVHNPYNLVFKFMQQGLSLRDASLKVIQIRNELTRALEVIHNMMDKAARQSLQKGMRMEVGLATEQSNGFRHGWVDNAAAVDLYWPKEKRKDWKPDQTVLGSHT
ncbi:hypothetical protein HDE_08897 [Halotydeus destructor]|nr:hypothetical protein HDE_08897 [Halotydeus destructor]